MSKFKNYWGTVCCWIAFFKFFSNYKVRAYNKIWRKKFATVRNQCQPCTVCSKACPWAAECSGSVPFLPVWTNLWCLQPICNSIWLKSKLNYLFHYAYKQSLWYRLERCAREGGQLVKYLLLKNWIREQVTAFRLLLGIMLLSRICVQPLSALSIVELLLSKAVL